MHVYCGDVVTVIGDDWFTCPMCNRKHSQPRMTWHHLLPTVDSIEKDEEPRIYICETCHSTIHHCHTNKELRETYNTFDKLCTSSKILTIIELYKYKADDKIYRVKKLLKAKDHNERKKPKL